nr:hypothetical protein Iba_scaffold67827CG0010 [Ipomoea batatas]GME14250.1 hypothetical protein Iba_scaffold15106CG0030 [Ipomoea batatas]GME14730.1 hypothetical protein Iba_scaffold15400CG0440 [Ipomoea batatas]
MKQSSYVSKLAFVKVGDGRYVCLPAGYSDLQLLAAVSVSEQEMTNNNYEDHQLMKNRQQPAEKAKKRSLRSKNVRRNCGDNISPDSVLMLSSKRMKRKWSEKKSAQAAKKQLTMKQ